MSTVTIEEAKSALGQLIERAAAGEDVVIVGDGKPVARITPISQEAPKPPRVPGSMKGKIWMSPDCWDPDPELIRIMEEGPIFPDESPVQP